MAGVCPRSTRGSGYIPRTDRETLGKPKEMEEHRIQRATDGTTSDPEDIPEPVLDVVDADDTLSEAADSVETLVDVVPDQ